MYVAPIGTAGQSIIERIFIMIYDEIADTLLRAGIPVNTKGFIYIHDAFFPERSVRYTQR